MGENVTTRLFDLVGRTFGLWRGHQENAVKGSPQRSNCVDPHPEVGNNDSIANGSSWPTRVQPSGFERYACDAANKSISGGQFEIDEWCASACDRRNLAGDTWNDLDLRRFVGFIGHDGSPHVWNSELETWTPLPEQPS